MQLSGGPSRGGYRMDASAQLVATASRIGVVLQLRATGVHAGRSANVGCAARSAAIEGQDASLITSGTQPQPWPPGSCPSRPPSVLLSPAPYDSGAADLPRACPV